MRPRGLIPAYATAILNYFQNYDAAAFKNKENVRKYFDAAAPELKAVYDKARYELASPLVKFFRGNPRVFKLSAVLMLMIVVIGGMLIVMQANGGFKKEPEKQVNAEAKPPVAATENQNKAEEPKEPIEAAKEVLGLDVQNDQKRGQNPRDPACFPFQAAGFLPRFRRK